MYLLLKCLYIWYRALIFTFVFFQHPFINKELDSKSIRDLLLEYKAEVVEEEVVDEDADVSVHIITYRIALFTSALVVRSLKHRAFFEVVWRMNTKTICTISFRSCR